MHSLERPSCRYMQVHLNEYAASRRNELGRDTQMTIPAPTQYVWSHTMQYRALGFPAFTRPQVGHASGCLGVDGDTGGAAGFGAVGGTAGIVGFVEMGTAGFAEPGAGGVGGFGGAEGEAGLALTGAGGIAGLEITGAGGGACGFEAAAAGAGGGLIGSGSPPKSSSIMGALAVVAGVTFSGGGFVAEVARLPGETVVPDPVRTVTVTFPTSLAKPSATELSRFITVSSQITWPLRMKNRNAKGAAPRAQTVHILASPPIFTGSGPRLTAIVSRAPYRTSSHARRNAASTMATIKPMQNPTARPPTSRPTTSPTCGVT